jgi:hypothetical protein
MILTQYDLTSGRCALLSMTFTLLSIILTNDDDAVCTQDEDNILIHSW